MLKKKMRRSVSVLGLLAGVAWLSFAQRQGGNPSKTAATRGISDMLEDRLRSVVTVKVDSDGAEASPFFGIVNPSVPPPKAKALEGFFQISSGGSGFVLRRGQVDYVVTNAHVVQNSNLDKVFAISLTGKRYALEFVGADSIRDIAVLKFSERPGTEISSATIRKEPVRVGERVFALGTPLGLYPSSVSEGIVSGLNRQSPDAYSSYIQTTAALSNGNSGGPLIDDVGRVIGVNTWGALGRSGDVQFQLNFALNGATAADTVEQIIAKGRVARGSLGLIIAEDPEDPDTFAVAYALDSMPAATREKVIGRGLLSIEGVALRNRVQLLGILDAIKPNQSVRLGLAASKTAPAEEVTITSRELTDARLEEVTVAYLKGILGVSVTADKEKLQVELKQARFAKNQTFQIKSILNQTIAAPNEKDFTSFSTQLGGLLRIDSDGTPILINDDIYGLRNERDLQVLIRARSAMGVLTFLAAVDDEPYAISVWPQVENQLLPIILH